MTVTSVGFDDRYESHRRAWYLYHSLTLSDTVKSKQLVVSWIVFLGLPTISPSQRNSSVVEEGGDALGNDEVRALDGLQRRRLSEGDLFVGGGSGPRSGRADGARGRRKRLARTTTALLSLEAASSPALPASPSAPSAAPAVARAAAPGLVGLTTGARHVARAADRVRAREL